MIRHSYEDPGIAYTATKLGDFANDHGVAVDVNATYEAFTTAAGPELMYGPLLPSIFDVNIDIPTTVPTMLERLAIYDHEQPNEEYDPLCGILANRCLWLALDDVGFTDQRLKGILDIVGANRQADEEEFGMDENDEPTVIHRHYYMESDQYSVQLTHRQLEELSGVQIMRVDFVLPDRDP